MRFKSYSNCCPIVCRTFRPRGMPVPRRANDAILVERTKAAITIQSYKTSSIGKHVVAKGISKGTEHEIVRSGGIEGSGIHTGCRTSSFGLHVLDVGGREP